MQRRQASIFLSTATHGSVMKNYKGKFYWLSTQDNPDFYTTSGKVIADVYVDDLDPPMQVLLDIVLDDQKTLVSYRRDPSEPVGAPSDHRNVALVLVDGDDFTERDELKIKERAKRVQDEYNRACQGYKTIKVDPFTLKTDTTVDLRSNALWSEIRSLVGDSYSNLHAVGGYSNSYCGIAWLGGNEAVTFNPWTCGWKTSSHEDGHNAGLSHAGTADSEYGERDRIMGSGGGRRWFSPAHLHRLGALPHDQYKTIQENESNFIWLPHFNTIEMAVPTGAYRAAFLKPSNSSSYNNDGTLVVSRDDQGVTIHEIKGRKTILHKTLKKEDTYEKSGFSFEYAISTGDLAGVSINSAEKIEVPVYAKPEEPASFEGKSGIWANREWDAQGVHIRYLNNNNRNQVWVAWLTWDYNYNRVYYWGVLDVVDNIASGDLRDLYNNIAGTAQLWFEDDNNGSFYAQVDKESFASPLNRISVGEQGAYYGFGSNKGVSLEKTSNDQTVGYILTSTKTHPTASPTSDWLMHLDGVVYKPEGGMRGSHTDTEMTRVGNCEFLDNNKFVWDGTEYDLVHLA